MSSIFLKFIIIGAQILGVLCAEYARNCSCAAIHVKCNFRRLFCSFRDDCKHHKENVALGKTTRISSVFNANSYPRDQIPFLGCLAVNGDLNSPYKHHSASEAKEFSNCYRSGQKDLTPFWEVDLGRIYTVVELTIIVDPHHKEYMKNTDISVDTHSCRTITNAQTTKLDMLYVTCRSPVAGRVVRLSKKSVSRNKYDFYLAFCEVEVWVCQRGRYGPLCNFTCAASCLHCDNYYGFCGACTSGYYGKHCTELCKCGGRGCRMNGSCIIQPLPTPESKHHKKMELALAPTTQSGRICSCVAIGVHCDFSGIFCSDHDKCKTWKENVALGRPTYISSLSEPELYPTEIKVRQGCLAVNGNVRSHYIPYSSKSDNKYANCYRSGEHDINPTWEVDLLHTFTITDITIVVDAAHKTNLRETKVYVNNDLCLKIHDVAITRHDMIHLSCNIPLRGHIVRLTKNEPIIGTILQHRLLSFCEVQVWVCRPGLYGESCNKECPVNCRHCDNYYGTCRGGCAKGYYGTHCNKRCRNCEGNMCYANGNCTSGCKSGWHGERCDIEDIITLSREPPPEEKIPKAGPMPTTKNVPMPTTKNVPMPTTKNVPMPTTKNVPMPTTKYVPNIIHLPGNKEVCNRGFYGPECNIPCGHCNDNFCRRHGTCTFGCKVGWIGDLCNKKKPSGKRHRKKKPSTKNVKISSAEYTLDRKALHIAVGVLALIILSAVVITIWIFYLRERPRAVKEKDKEKEKEKLTSPVQEEYEPGAYYSDEGAYVQL